MKSNIIKYFLIFGLLASALTTQSICNARSFSANSDWKNCSRSQISSNYDYVNNLNYINNRFYYTKSSGSNIITGNLFTLNGGDFCRSDYYWYANYGNHHRYTTYNFIKFWGANGVADFYVRNEKDLSYRLVSVPQLGYSEIIDGESVVFDMFFPRHGSILFYSSSSKHTIQIIGDKTLYDLAIYIDPLEDYKNLYVINFHKGKAWSMKMTDLDQLSSYLFGGWSSDSVFFNNLEDALDVSYNLTGGGTYFRPQTAGQGYSSYYSSADGTHEFSTEQSKQGLTNAYVADFKFEKPDFGFIEDLEPGFSDNSYSNYVSCRDRYSNISNWANSEYLCRNDMNNGSITTGYFENLFSAIYNYSGVDSIVGQTRNCQDWIDYSVIAYNDPDIGNGSLTGYRENFLISDRNSWAINMLNIDNYCTYETPITTGVVADYSLWSCVAAHLGFYGNVNTADYCNQDFGGNDTTSSEVDNVLIQVQKKVANPFFTVYDQIEDAFMSGYNEVQGIAGYDLTCDSNVYGKSYYWGNIAVIGICAWLVFIFLSVV